MFGATGRGLDVAHQVQLKEIILGVVSSVICQTFQAIAVQDAITVGKKENGAFRQSNAVVASARNAGMWEPNGTEPELRSPRNRARNRSLTAVVNNDDFEFRRLVLDGKVLETPLERRPIVIGRDNDADAGFLYWRRRHETTGKR